MSLYLGTSPIADSGNGKANTSLSNLTNTGKNIANWSNNVTNCITEIPQDIKLELNNGTLTLKAGSKVYVPNGAGVFNAITVPSDVVFHSGTIGTSTSDFMICCNLTGGFGVRATPNSFVSGETAPTNTSQIWYDTTNNMIKVYENGSWVQKSSLPIGIYHRENGNAVSIKQVFNGFGYIGSTVFALPGVKGLIPNGRNADGTLKSIEVVLNKVVTDTKTEGAYTYSLQINYASTMYGTMYRKYKEDINYNLSTYSNEVAFDYTAGIYSTDSNGKITSLTPKTAFHAVDYNDFNNIPHIIETYVNGTSWYRVYSDGWCEQGGHWNSSSNGFQTITLLKPYKDTNYNVQVTVAHTGATYTTGAAPCYYSAAYKTVSSFQCYGYSDASLANKDWMACGYIN